MFANIEVDNTIKVEKDRTGGGSYVLDSNIYPAKIKLAYTGQSKRGANSITLVFTTTEGKEIKETLYVSSGTDKGQKAYYEAKDGSRKFLPGYEMLESLCQVALGKSVSAVGTEEKLIKLYDYQAKAEVPTKVPVVTELLDKEVYVAVVKEIQDKNVRDASGNYVPSGDTREVNVIDKFFRAADKMTYAEAIDSNVTEANFFSTWKEQNEGKTRDKSTKTSGTTGAPQLAAVAQPKPAAATASMFT